jgi:hypothetical protein
MTDTSERLVKTLESVATDLTHVIIYGGALCLTILITKLFTWKRKKPEFAIAGISINLDYAWALIAGLTAAHAYIAFLFVRVIGQIVEIRDPTLGEHAWNSLVGDLDKLTIFFSLEPRPSITILGAVLSEVSFNLEDPILWLHAAITAAIVPAVVRWRAAIWTQRVMSSTLALFLLLANWYCGSAWALSAVDLERVAKRTPVRMCAMYELVLGSSHHPCGPRK